MHAVSAVVHLGAFPGGPGAVCFDGAKCLTATISLSASCRLFLFPFLSFTAPHRPIPHSRTPHGRSNMTDEYHFNGHAAKRENSPGAGSAKSTSEIDVKNIADAMDVDREGVDEKPDLGKDSEDEKPQAGIEKATVDDLFSPGSPKTSPQPSSRPRTPSLSPKREDVKPANGSASGSRAGSSQRAMPSLIPNLPTAWDEAHETFTTLEKCVYERKELGLSREQDDMMVCDCVFDKRELSHSFSCSVRVRWVALLRRRAVCAGWGEMPQVGQRWRGGVRPQTSEVPCRRTSADPSDNPDAQPCSEHSDCINRALFIECIKSECRAKSQCKNQR